MSTSTIINQKATGSSGSSVSSLSSKGYEQLTSLASVSALTVPTGAISALIQAESQSVRWRDDGIDPTTSVGMILAAGDTIFFTGNLSNFKVIEITNSAKINILYYG